MEKISRRKFLYFFALLSCAHPRSIAAASIENGPRKDGRYPMTIAVLKAAYESEKAAAEHYAGYSRKAVEEKFFNIAYLFTSFEFSEKIHADNYKRILASLGAGLKEPEFKTNILDTKANLIKAAEAELQKINRTYPDFLAKLKKESHDQAVVNCMYSWKSHRQHERKIAEIRKYSPLFFGIVAQKIEEMKLDFHVCDICGSTIDEEPQAPCEICNYPISHYDKVIRPA
jgi:rubrerythrin